MRRLPPSMPKQAAHSLASGRHAGFEFGLHPVKAGFGNPPHGKGRGLAFKQASDREISASNSKAE